MESLQDVVVGLAAISVDPIKAGLVERALQGGVVEGGLASLIVAALDEQEDRRAFGMLLLLYAQELLLNCTSDGGLIDGIVLTATSLLQSAGPPLEVERVLSALPAVLARPLHECLSDRKRAAVLVVGLQEHLFPLMGDCGGRAALGPFCIPLVGPSFMAGLVEGGLAGRFRSLFEDACSVHIDDLLLRRFPVISRLFQVPPPRGAADSAPYRLLMASDHEKGPPDAAISPHLCTIEPFRSLALLLAQRSPLARPVEEGTQRRPLARIARMELNSERNITLRREPPTSYAAPLQDGIDNHLVVHRPFLASSAISHSRVRL